MSRERVAVVGSGVSGLTAAYLLQRRYEVLLFEADARLGGHAHTHEVSAPDGRTVCVDTGFLVHNQRTYPTLLRLFAELGVQTQDAEMSMSIRCRECGLQYAGARGVGGILPTAGTLTRLPYLRLLARVRRFHRLARELLEDPSATDLTLSEFVARGGFSPYFIDHFLHPLVATVWSSDERTAGRYPAQSLFQFLRNHGMLSVTGSPQWRTVVGGSRTYVETAVKSLTAVRLATPVRSIARAGDGFTVHDDSDETHRIDRVVVATHADEALRLLADPTPPQRAALGAFHYSRNEATLHTDSTALPANRRVRASWNHVKPSCASTAGAVQVSYDLNRLMRLKEPVDYVATLGAAGQIDPGAVLRRMLYRHPVFTTDTLRAQRLLPALNDGRIAFAGAYHGWGFHEDGCASGARAAASMGVDW